MKWVIKDTRTECYHEGKIRGVHFFTNIKANIRSFSSMEAAQNKAVQIGLRCLTVMPREKI